MTRCELQNVNVSGKNAALISESQPCENWSKTQDCEVELCVLTKVNVSGKKLCVDFEGRTMRRLVEEVGQPLFAGWLSRLNSALGESSGDVQVGDREVLWKLGPGNAVTVTHLSADKTARPVCYRVRLKYKSLPTGGDRWWWACPSCRAPVDLLYLPSDRDRLACRKCCGLLYRSQYTGQKRRRRKRRPVVVVTIVREVWTAARGWVVSRRTVRQ